MMPPGGRPMLAKAAMMHAAAQHQQQMNNGGCGSGCPTYSYGGQPYTPPVATMYNPAMPRNCTSTRDQEVANEMMTAFPTANPADYEQVMASHPPSAQAAIATLIQIMQHRASQHPQSQQLYQQSVQSGYAPGGGQPTHLPFPFLHHFQNYNEFAAHPQQPMPQQPMPQQLPPNMVSPTGQVQPSGRKKALLIASNYEGTANQLSGCREDSRRIHDFLIKVYGFVDRPDCFLMLNDAPENKQGGRTQYLPNKQNILNGMRWLVDGASPGDCLFMHYSGHGGQAAAKHDQFEEDGKDETIYPLDFDKAGTIVDDEMNEILVAHTKEGVKLVVLLDCCHSGGALDLPHTFTGNDWRDSRVKTMPLADVVLISGCKSDQTSADIVNNDKTGGAMTTAFLASVLPDPFNLSHDKMMKDLNGCLKKRGFEQVSCLTSGQKFPAQTRLFRMDDIIRNTNRY